MRERLKEAAIAGLLLAVKWGVMVVVVGAMVLLAASDYMAVRAGSRQGAAAFTYLQQQLSKPVPQKFTQDGAKP